jgi:hypothetical protein
MLQPFSPLRDREAASPAHHAIAPKSKKLKEKQNVMLVVDNAMRPSQTPPW